LGIDLDWQVFDQATWTQKVKDKQYDLTLYFTRYGPEPDAYSEHFQTGGVRNFTGYSNEKVDRLLTQAREITDEGQRKAAYDQVRRRSWPTCRTSTCSGRSAFRWHATSGSVWPLTSAVSTSR
jgi:ABC-type transport system substrate-binding protein